jgi:hypothetical protein
VALRASSESGSDPKRQRGSRLKQPVALCNQSQQRVTVRSLYFTIQPLDFESDIGRYRKDALLDHGIT